MYFLYVIILKIVKLKRGFLMGKLTELPNIGPTLESQLNQIGIETLEELKEIGTEKAWLKIQAIDPSACIHRLYALEGAILGIKKNALPEQRKTELKAFYNKYKI